MSNRKLIPTATGHIFTDNRHTKLVIGRILTKLAYINATDMVKEPNAMLWKLNHDLHEMFRLEPDLKESFDITLVAKKGAQRHKLLIWKKSDKPNEKVLILRVVEGIVDETPTYNANVVGYMFCLFAIFIGIGAYTLCRMILIYKEVIRFSKDELILLPFTAVSGFVAFYLLYLITKNQTHNGNKN